MTSDTPPVEPTPSKPHLSNNQRRLSALIAVLVVLALWVLVTRDQSTHERLVLPSPEALIEVAVTQWSSLLLFSLTTWYRVLIGVIIGAVVGLLLGLAMTWSLKVESVVDPFIELIRPVPPIALTPFFILWFGLGDFGQFLLVSLGCFMVIVVTTVVAVRSANPIYEKAARSLGATTSQVYQTVYLNAITPTLQSGLRVAAATGFGLTVAAEYLGAQGGLGYLIRNARVILQTEVILLAVVVLGIESILTDQVIRLIFRRLTRWAPQVDTGLTARPSKERR